jgi:hypothetical protein
VHYKRRVVDPICWHFNTDNVGIVVGKFKTEDLFYHIVYT